MDKYPLLRDQVEKIVVQHGRKGEAKSKDQVLILKCKLLGAMGDAVQSEILAGGYSLHSSSLQGDHIFLGRTLGCLVASYPGGNRNAPSHYAMKTAISTVAWHTLTQ